MKLLLVDNDDLDRAEIRSWIARQFPTAEIREAEDAKSGIELFSDEPFDCIVLEYRLPDRNGIMFLSQLLESRDLALFPVIMVTGVGNETVAVQAMKLGVQDYLVKDSLTPEILGLAIRNALEKVRLRSELESARRQLEQRALYDPMTGLANRSLFSDRLAHALSIVRRREGTLSLLMLDLDGFKSINDTYGHHAGDQVIKAVGNRMTAILRDADTVARLGGDEFAVILETGMMANGAQIAAEKIARCIKDPITIDGRTVTIGVSIGIAVFADQADGDTIMRQADIAMYDAKRKGVDCMPFHPVMEMPCETTPPHAETDASDHQRLAATA